MSRLLLCVLVVAGAVETVSAGEPFAPLAERILRAETILVGSIEHVSHDDYALKVERVLYGRAPRKRIVRVIRDQPRDPWARAWKLRVGLRVLVFARPEQGAYGTIGGGGADEVALIDGGAHIPYSPGLANVSEDELLGTVQTVLKARATVLDKPLAASTSFLADQNGLTKRLGLDMVLRHTRAHGPLSLAPDLLEGLLWSDDRFLSSLAASNLVTLAGNQAASLRPTVKRKIAGGSRREKFTAALALCTLDPQNIDAHKALLAAIPQVELAYPDTTAVSQVLTRVDRKRRANAKGLYRAAAAALRSTDDRSLVGTLLSYLNQIHGESSYVPGHRVDELRAEWLKKLGQ